MRILKRCFLLWYWWAGCFQQIMPQQLLRYWLRVLCRLLLIVDKLIKMPGNLSGHLLFLYGVLYFMISGIEPESELVCHRKIYVPLGKELRSIGDDGDTDAASYRVMPEAEIIFME